jgi:hypothetical protein
MKPAPLGASRVPRSGEIRCLEFACDALSVDAGSIRHGIEVRDDDHAYLTERGSAVGVGRAAAGRREAAWQHRPAAVDELRFAFYGRISTADFQDKWSSRVWQRDYAPR